MAGDIYKKGEPLTRQGLFQLVTDEVFRDGVVDDDELDVVKKLSEFLGLEREVAMEIVAYSRQKFSTGLLKEKRALDPAPLYEEVLRYIVSDGELDPLEEKMLNGLRELFDIEDATHLEMMKRAQDLYGPVKS